MVEIVPPTREDIVDRVRLRSIDEREQTAYGVTYERGQRITIEHLGRLIEQDRLVPSAS